MADSDHILRSILTDPPKSQSPMVYQWLLPNLKGLSTYLTTWADCSASVADRSADQKPPRHEISIFMAATESFSRHNTNCSIAESLNRFEPLMADAKAHGSPVRAYISVALGCPYEGADVCPHKVAELASQLREMGAYQISVADTVRHGIS